MPISNARERGVTGDTMMLENTTAAEKRMEELSEATIEVARCWDWLEEENKRAAKRRDFGM